MNSQEYQFGYQDRSVARRRWSRVGLAALILAAANVSLAQDESPANKTTFKTLLEFDAINGGNPSGPLVQGLDGNLYGTTAFAGANGAGTVYKITTSGTLTVLHNFCSQSNCADGLDPLYGLVLSPDGDFYGTAGAVFFKITPAGALTTLYTFCSGENCTGGLYPNGVVLAADGNFYGTTLAGGAGNDAGVVFKLTPAGVFTKLYNFCSQPNCTDGSSPAVPLIQGTDGDFYGTTQAGGTKNDGTVFKITSEGVLTVLHSFDSSDGASPEAALVEAANGNFYGTTSKGGANADGGTIFEVTASGTFTLLYSFCSQTNCTDGNSPYAGLMQAVGENFYGDTLAGGSVDCTGNAAVPGCGTVFKMTPDGAVSTIYDLDKTDGLDPQAALVQHTNGILYGSANGGAINDPSECPGGCGALFSATVGAKPFVAMLPASGLVGAAVIILGTDLTGATSVTFNGVAANFTVASATEIKATVPAGATTGTVEVVTPKRTLKSNVQFRVTS